MGVDSDVDIDSEARKLMANGLPTLEFTVKAPWTVFDLGIRGFSVRRLRCFVFCRMTAEGLQIGDHFIGWRDFIGAEIRLDGPFDFFNIVPRRTVMFHIEASLISRRNDPSFYAKQHFRRSKSEKEASFSIPLLLDLPAGGLAVMARVFKRANELAIAAADK